MLKNNLSIIFYWIISVAITLIFQDKISVFLAENSFIKHSNVKDIYFQIAFIIFLIVIVIRYLWFIIKNYQLARKNNFIIFFISIIYLFLRINEHDLLFFSYFNLKFNLFYSDIILLIGILSILLLTRNLFFKNWKLYDKLSFWFSEILENNEKNFESFLIEDIPFDNKNNNDNEKVIDELIKAVINLKPKRSFIIGMNSIWGIGKTSFLKRLEYKLKLEEIQGECKPITFWFNAWQHQDEKSIINNFFNQLKKELSKFSGDSKNSIDNYLKEMLALVDNKYLNFFKTITENLFGNNDTLEGFYNDINDIIEKIDRKIIVFVDDIDRLNKNEILEVLRVLRNIANFKNVIFICGFDRDYVIRQSQIDNYYLDKIFNLEINLTAQNPNHFVIYLIEIIEKSNAYNDEDKKSLIASINKIFYANDYLISFFDELIVNDKIEEVMDLPQLDLKPSFFFESRRDVKKFFNELYINIKTLKNISDLELVGYVELKLLLFKYKWMYRNFTSKRISSWLGDGDVLKFEAKNLNNIYTHPDIEKQDKIIIYSILKKIFPDADINADSKNISNRRYFPIYLSNNIFNESFSFTELYKAIEDSKVEELIIENVNGKENEVFIKDDIKTFILKSENISNVSEYKQVIYLIKKGLLGHIHSVEILNLINIGETKFETEFKKLLDTIFDNFDDDFGAFLNELSEYYFTFPKTSVDDYYSIKNSENSQKIDDFKILTQKEILKILFSLIQKQIEVNDNPIEILFYSKLFYFRYYSILNFGILLNEFRELILKFIMKNFESIFLKDKLGDITSEIDFYIIANIFEDSAERENLIAEAELLIEQRDSPDSFNYIKEAYIKNGLNRFIIAIESLDNVITQLNREKYLKFLAFLYAYKENDYKFLPSSEELENN
ncbi:P-loop NTPase fold protein [Flavobacterium sp. HJSW_4]|uniref:KAP family P-loop NTPase fold protein n=1 Tax=Flavobacterium sp. HJSW_4 TaxID=3344660 RepID=UPI0035F2E523